MLLNGGKRSFAFKHMLECEFAFLVFKKNNLRTTLCFYSLFGSDTGQHKKILNCDLQRHTVEVWKAFGLAWSRFG